MDNKSSWVLILFVIIIVLIIYWRVRKNFKFLKVPSVCLVTGGVKTGKSMLSVNLSQKDYIKVHRSWWFATKFLHKKLEEPLYYTNSYTNFGILHKKLNNKVRYIGTEHLLREIRFNYKSIIYVNEASLMADNMDFNDKVRNVDLSLFNKLISHMTKGGKIYYDTQSPLDCHYSIKRVCSTYFFIQKQLNLLLFHVLYVRELVNMDIGVNDFTDDVDTTTRKVLIPFWWHKHYDRYYFSYLTDDLKKKNEKAKLYGDLVSFNPLYIERADKRIKEVAPKVIEGATNPTIEDLYKDKEVINNVFDKSID